MVEEPVRMGYVGCGFLAQHTHLPNFASLEGCRLIALAEMRPRLARQVADRFRIPTVYGSHLELAADPEVEAVGVSAGFAQQGEIAADLLRAGKHVFMEKPMAISLNQAERILAAAREGKARLFVAYMKRYDPGNQLARATIARWRAEGERGQLLYARNHGFCGNWIAELDTSRMIRTDEPLPPASTQEHLPAWLPADAARNYVNYLQQYTHNINLLRYLLDAGDDARVRSVDLDPDGLTGLVVLELAGARSVIESGSTTFHSWDEHTQVYFQKGWIHIWSPALFTVPAQSRVEVYEGGEHAGYHYPVVRPQTAWHYREEAASFVRALRTGEPFLSSGEDTLTDIRMYEQIYRRHLGIEEAAPAGR
ncbi:MAG TPA: Gfo/Idh/MocA family oxidoreductase [Chloroflexota bacterium]|nr:Gfo/Idh/MocA family oxidoreductase [Chloroflexota bacterium]